MPEGSKERGVGLSGSLDSIAAVEKTIFEKLEARRSTSLAPSPAEASDFKQKIIALGQHAFRNQPILMHMLSGAHFSLCLCVTPACFCVVLRAFCMIHLSAANIVIWELFCRYPRRIWELFCRYLRRRPVKAF